MITSMKNVTLFPMALPSSMEKCLLPNIMATAVQEDENGCSPVRLLFRLEEGETGMLLKLYITELREHINYRTNVGWHTIDLKEVDTEKVTLHDFDLEALKETMLDLNTVYIKSNELRNAELTGSMRLVVGKLQLQLNRMLQNLSECDDLEDFKIGVILGNLTNLPEFKREEKLLSLQECMGLFANILSEGTNIDELTYFLELGNEFSELENLYIFFGLMKFAYVFLDVTDPNMVGSDLEQMLISALRSVTKA